MVSIHAPTRGATKSNLSRRVSVSIHAPTRGATRAIAGNNRVRLPDTCFNPRPHAGGDPLTVSIHAPTRGADSAPADSWPSNAFQSTPPRGGRLAWFASGRLPRFNPRPHAGGDLSARSRLVKHCFNPRPHAGGDHGWPHPLPDLPSKLFQSTPPRGGRHGCCNHDRTGSRPWQFQVSIHAPTRGATAKAKVFPGDNTWFQSTPPRGGRQDISDTGHNALTGHCFNPRPHAGGDGIRPNGPCWTMSFNPRPHAGGDLSISSARSAGFNPRPHAGGD